MMQTFVIGRGIDDTSKVLVSLKLGDVEKAKAFAASDDLKMRMDSAGVNGPPDIMFTNIIRFDTMPSTATTRLIVRHKVKDFDAWLAVYDREGPSTRASHGIKDRGLGRGIDDPNLVSLVFDVTDIDKARARAGSEELKALMSEAGVEGEPTMYWYTVVDQF
jgi:hypothetical protein